MTDESGSPDPRFARLRERLRTTIDDPKDELADHRQWRRLQARGPLLGPPRGGWLVPAAVAGLALAAAVVGWRAFRPEADAPVARLTPAASPALPARAPVVAAPRTAAVTRPDPAPAPPVPDLPLQIEASDRALEAGAQAALRAAPELEVRDSPLGALFVAAWEGQRFIYARDFAHQMLGAHLLGWGDHVRNGLELFAESASEATRWRIARRIDYVRLRPQPAREAAAASFDLLARAFELYQWSGDRLLFEDEELWRFFTMTVTELVRAHDGGQADGVVDGAGSGYSSAGDVRWQGRVLRDAPRSVIAADALALQHDALRGYAAFAEHRGQAAEAAEARTRADALADRFRGQLWDEGAGLYARGLDGEGRPLGGYNPEASLFGLRSRLVEPGPRARAMIDVMLAQGRRDTVQARSYRPEHLFPHGALDLGYDALVDLARQPMRFSEVALTVPYHVVRWLLGVAPDAPGDRVEITANLPSHQGPVRVAARGIRIGTHRLAVEQRRTPGQHQTTVVQHLGGQAPLELAVMFHGAQSVQLDGRAPDPGALSTRTTEAGLVSVLTTRLAPGATVTVQATALAQPEWPATCGGRCVFPAPTTP